MKLFGSRLRQDPGRATEIKEWAAEVFRLPADASVLVTELHCTEPGCPPLETVIAVLDQPGRPRQYKVHKAMADVTFADLLHLAGNTASEVCRETENPS
jgi:hypothetical protein